MAIMQSQVVVVAQVEAYQGDKDPEAPKVPEVSILPPGKPFTTMSTGPDFFVAVSKQQNAGTYRLRALKYLKGGGEPVLSLRLPPLYSFAYDSRIHIAPGDMVLLMAVRDAKNVLQPLDPWRPLIPLSKAAIDEPKNTEEGYTPLDRIYNLLLASMAEPSLRRMHAFILRDVADTELVPRLVPYINDPDERVREHVIENMALNQQVAVIPRIVALSEAAWRESKGMYSGGPVTRLGKFTVPQARPYLNQALFSPEQFARLNALSSLVHLADRSSVPYLLLTLSDAQQKDNAQSAYYILHQVLPALGKPPSPDDFWKNRDAETTRLLAWWRDELSGKHPKLEGEAPAPIIDFERIKAEDATRILNPLLFEKKPELRRQAADALQKAADASSIPYLLLALHDPDDEVSFLAYRTLHRLIATMTPPTARPLFEAKREVYTQELFDWWRDELSAKHFAPDPPPAALPARTFPRADAPAVAK